MKVRFASLILLILLISGAAFAGGAVSPVVAVLLVGEDSEKRPLVAQEGTAFYVGGGKFYTAAHIVELNTGGSILGNLGWWIGADFLVVAPALAVGLPFTFGRDVFGPATQTCVDKRWQSTHSMQASVYDFGSFVIAIGGEKGDVPASLPVYKVSQVDPRVGDKVTGEGYPVFTKVLSVIHSRTYSGEVVQVEPGMFLVRIDEGLSAPGSSGAPVLNTSGEVVGVQFAGDHQEITPDYHIWATIASAMRESNCQ